MNLFDNEIAEIDDLNWICVRLFNTFTKGSILRKTPDKDYLLYLKNNIADITSLIVGISPIGEIPIIDIVFNNDERFFKKLNDVKEKYIDKIDQFESLIEDAVERVIEFMKEDIADSKGIDPDDIETMDLGNYYDLDEQYTWWLEEWSHNIEKDLPGKNWFEKISRSDFRRYGGIDGVESYYYKVSSEMEKETEESVDDIFKAIVKIREEVLDNKSSLFRSIF